MHMGCHVGLHHCCIEGLVHKPILVHMDLVEVLVAVVLVEAELVALEVVEVCKYFVVSLEMVLAAVLVCELDNILLNRHYIPKIGNKNNEKSKKN